MIMKKQKTAGKTTGKEKKGVTPGQSKENEQPKTDLPLSEKDEEKQAEEEQRQRNKKA